MKYFIRYIYLSLLLFMGACSTDEVVSDHSGSDLNEEVVINFQVYNQLNTRTTLVSSDNIQHVSYVHLYVFNGTDETATCIADENVGWKQPIGNTADQFYKLTTKLPKNSTYTLLAVGLDCTFTDQDQYEIDLNSGSAATYSLPDSITSDPEGVSGTTLSGAIATLATGKTQDDIAHSELFAGSTVFTTNNNGSGSAIIIMNRRVAGVLGYFQNIPSGVTDIKLILHKNQYMNVPLLTQTNDYGSEILTESTTVLDIPVSNDILGEVNMTAADGTTYTKLSGSVLQAVYMLPLDVPAETTTNTFTLETYNGETLVKSYSVKFEDSTIAFPILANHFYSLGIKNSTTDDPIDLGGTIDETVIIRVDGSWQADIDIPM